jgi:putative membrane protein
MQTRRFIRSSALVVSAALFTAAPVFAQTDTGAGGQAATAPASSGPTDPQIAAIAVAANKVDADAGKFAESHTKNRAVKAFAQTMVRDHTGANKQASALVKELKVKPEENDTSKALTQGGKDNLANLKKLKGAEFDKAYVDHEVAYHQQVLDAINNVLIPNAKNPKLKALLEKVGPVVQAHLEHAKKLQGELGGGSEGTK